MVKVRGFPYFRELLSFPGSPPCIQELHMLLNFYFLPVYLSYINLLIRLAKEPRGEGKAFPLILCVYIYIHTIYTAVKSNYFPIIVIIIFQIH